MAKWKYYLICGVSIGISFGLIVLFGGKYINGKKDNSKLWDNNSIEASFVEVKTRDNNKYLVFNYVLNNKTDKDYRFSTNSTIMAKLLKEKSYVYKKDSELVRYDQSIYLPAGQKVVMHIYLDYEYTGKIKYPSDDNDKDAIKKYNEAVLEFVRSNLSNLDGFTIFDEMNRIKIDFKKEW